MARGSNLYRRGAVYWWRRRLAFRYSEKSTISLSLSLLTRELSIARARGAAMTMASERLRMSIQQRVLAGTITPEAAERIAQAEMQHFRATVLAIDASLTVEADAAPMAPPRSLVCLEQFWSGIERGGLVTQPDDEYASANWPALNDVERAALAALAARIDVRAELATTATARLVDQGIEPAAINLAIAQRLLIRARAKTAHDVVSGDPWGQGSATVYPATTTQAAIDIDSAPRGIIPPQGLVPLALPVAEVRNDDYWPGATEEARLLLAMTPVELANEFIRRNYSFLDHRTGGKRQATTTGEHTCRQILCAARLLQQSLPVGATFSSITPEQVMAFDALLDQLPVSFGKAKAQHELTLELAAVAASTTEKVAAGALSLDKVGFTIITSNKHFRYLQRLNDLLIKKHFAVPKLPFGDYIHADCKSARDARVEYTPDQGEMIFSLPPWTGCAGLHDRLAPGLSIIYDALYWVLLLVWYTGARREEICSLRLSQIRSEFDIDYLDIVDGKTVNATRRLAIATELKRVGFLTYVEAMREAGETMLFPDIQPGKAGKRTLGDVFYKLWWIYLKPMLPGLVLGQAMHSCRHMVSTELKELQVFPEYRNDVLGQGQQGSEGVTRYSKATRLRRVQEVVDMIPVVTSHLPDFSGSIKLLPAALRVSRPTREA